MTSETIIRMKNYFKVDYNRSAQQVWFIHSLKKLFLPNNLPLIHYQMNILEFIFLILLNRNMKLIIFYNRKGAELLRDRHTLFSCPLLYCTSQITAFLFNKLKVGGNPVSNKPVTPVSQQYLLSSCLCVTFW